MNKMIKIINLLIRKLNKVNSARPSLERPYKSKNVRD